jgi:hypothetical protein
MPVSQWLKAVSGNDNTPTNWNPQGIPSAIGETEITIPGTYTVTSSQNNTTGELDLISTVTFLIAADEFSANTFKNFGTISIANGATLASVANSLTMGGSP